MGTELLPDLGTEIVIPACAVVGIVFALFQWVLVSKVKLTNDKFDPAANNKNGVAESLIEEEEGVNQDIVVQKCADIQSAISEGIMHPRTNVLRPSLAHALTSIRALNVQKCLKLMIG